MQSTSYLRSFSFKNLPLCFPSLPETRAKTFQRWDPQGGRGPGWS